MRIGVVPETLRERLALWLGRVPTPLAETQAAFLQARALMTAAEVGLFEALAAGPAPAGAVAAACGTDPAATRQLLDTLAAARYVRRRRGTYALSPAARRWLLDASPHSLAAKLGFLRDEWSFAEELSAFVRTGRPLDLHARLTPDGWARYQAAMRDLARLSAAEVGRRVPLPRGAKHLLDLGGAHGLYAAALCARHPALRATVLDLPEAVAASAAGLAGVSGGDRVRFEAADVRQADLGTATADAVLVANLAHHLTEAENRALVCSAVRALRPRGTLAVLEWLRPGDDTAAPRAGFGALLGLYFGLTSRSGTWTAGEVTAWLREAGLRPSRPRWLATLPGTALLVAHKG